jgi:glycosyltransferase involved in cell wall biosynthesis
MTVAARYGVGYYVPPLKGLSRARNVGTCATRADIIAFLDDDMVPHARWRDSLIAEFADKDVMAVTGPRAAARVHPWERHRAALGS